MAHGLRGRFAVLGAGMLICTGLVGCMNDEPKKPIKGPSGLTPSSSTIPGSSVKTGTGTPAYGSGVQPAAYNTTGARAPQPDYFKTGAIGGNTNFGTPTVPGSTGAGAPMGPTAGSVIPPISAPGNTTSYNPGTALPSDPYGSSRAPVTNSPPDGFGPLPPAAPGGPAAPTTGYPPQYKN